MTRRERLAWWMVCIVPQRLARWLMFDKLGERVKLPSNWVPYLFGRALGVDGSRCRLDPSKTIQLPLAKAEPVRAGSDLAA